MSNDFSIELVKTIPVTSTLGTQAYDTGGVDKYLEIVGVTDIRWETNKTLIPIPFLQYDYDGTDGSVVKIIDLKNLSEKLTITGWLEDDDTETAWQKAWMLRAMEVVGGPLKYLAIGPGAYPNVLLFHSGTISAYLERVSWNYKSHDTPITSQPGIGKIEITLVFTIANNKMG